MSNLKAVPERDALCLDRLQAELSACLAFSRATLQALAALSPAAARAAIDVLGDEVCAAPSAAAQSIIQDVHDELDCPAGVRALERAVIRAAQDLSQAHGDAGRAISRG